MNMSNGIKDRHPNSHSVHTEILCPAGSMEALYAGINAGADAVYLGGTKFGARAYAENLDEENMRRAIDYVHLHGKKIYLTVNTLLKNREIQEELYQYLLPLYKEGLDAVIVQDLGVFRLVKHCFPGMDIHASTQMVITGVPGAELLKEMGASRIVTARELSLEEIKEIHNQVDIEIESFVHGAMCYSYSGQCLFSSILGGRSGNRGRCAGPCRQPYQVLADGKRKNDANSQYVLSLRDMNTLSILPKILQAGVYSLKIEGRMKSPEYAAGTVELYRKYVDYCYSFRDLSEAVEKYHVNSEDRNRLAGLYSRSGSTTGYYECHNSKKMVSIEKPAYQTESERYVEELREKYVSSNKKIPVYMKGIFVEGHRMELTLRTMKQEQVTTVSVSGELLQSANNRPATEEDIIKQLCKLGNTPFVTEQCEIILEGNLFIPNKQLNELRRDAVDALMRELLIQYQREEDMVLPYDTQKQIVQNAGAHDCVLLTCKVHTFEQLEVVCSSELVDTIMIGTERVAISEILPMVRYARKHRKKVSVMLPYIFRKHAQNMISEIFDQLENEGITWVACNMDEISFLRKRNAKSMTSDASLYAFNSESIICQKELSSELVTIPYELNYKEMKHLSKQSVLPLELIVYGQIPLMVSANCMNQTISGICDKSERKLSIVDRLGKEFLVANVCKYCYNVIYNNQPLSLLGVMDKVSEMVVHSHRMDFVWEDSGEVQERLDLYKMNWMNRNKTEEKFSFTRGHFNRGVE